MNALSKQNYDAEIVTVNMACEKSNLSRKLLLEVAQQAGAVIRIGNAVRIIWPKYYDYLVKHYTVQEQPDQSEDTAQAAV